MSKYSWHTSKEKDDGGWYKCDAEDPFLIRVESEMDEKGNPHFIRYGFGKTHLFDGYIDRIKSSLCSGFECEPLYK